MDEVARGNLRVRIGLRKPDPFKETARELDRVVLNARKRFRKTESVFRETKRLIDSIGEVRDEFLAEKCRRLGDNIEELERCIKS